jgi:hypothetical protein
MPWPFRRTESSLQRAEKEKRDKERIKQALEDHPSSRFPPTQVSFADPTFPEPPSLNYSLYPRIRSLIFFWTLVFIDVVCVPIVLYFTLWYKTKLSHNAGKFGELLL